MRRITAEVGHCIAVLKLCDESGIVKALDLMSPSVVDDAGHYAPAESITIGTRENVLKLKAFLDANLQAVEATS